MSAPIIRRVCSSCLLRRQFSRLTTATRLLTNDVQSCGIKVLSSPVWNGKLMSRHWLQHNNRLLGTSSSNTSNTTSVPRVTQTIPTDTNAELEEVLPNDAGVVTKVNEAIVDQAVGRLFAVIQVAGKQYKITTDDIVVVEGFFVPEVGDRIRLEKVLLAGSKDFTLVGRPLLDREVVKVEGTVIEKTLAVPKVRFHYIRRKGHRKFKHIAGRDQTDSSSYTKADKNEPQKETYKSQGR